MTKLNIAALGALLQGNMEDYITASTPGGIEAQEAQGQVMFNRSDILPKDLNRQSIELFLEAGFQFGQEVDDIFVQGKLPPGWSKQPTEHSMWTNLVDEQGRNRGAVFYKAAFYDRTAHMTLNRRYYYGTKRVDDGMPYGIEGDWYGVIMDTARGIPIWQTPTFTLQDGEWSRKDVLERVAQRALENMYPDWQNPNAYWDQ